MRASDRLKTCGSKVQSMKYPISLSIFFPAHNEETNIETTIRRAVRVAEESPFINQYEVIIVDDGSTDRTFALAENLAERYPAVRVIRHEKNKGYGAALKTGLSSAQMDYVFFTDADLQFDILELQNLLVHIPAYEAVIGYRAPRRDPFMRLLNARGWNFLNRLLFGLRVRDIDCAFKIFKRELVQDLVLKSEGAMINAEILVRLKRQGVSLKEVPVSHLPRKAGSPTGAKPSVIFRAFKEMVSLYSGDLGSVTHKQALRFATVGIVNTILDAAIYILLTRFLGFGGRLVVAKFFSFLVGTISSLLLNRSWTFGIRSRLSIQEIIRFYATVSISLLINVGAMSLLVSMGVYDLLALLLTTGITFLTNFTLSKLWVFKQKKPVLAPQ
jgi:glycosyltransferase involved in cell wall biosynthesis